MNKPRRKELQEIHDLLSEIREKLEAVKDEEEGYRDNIPENLQGSERYERAEEVVGGLDEALCDLDTVLDAVEEAWQ